LYLRASEEKMMAMSNAENSGWPVYKRSTITYWRF
jgi:hypothetical protein